MTTGISIVQGGIDNLDELQQLYVDTIQQVCIHDYDEGQRAVWASGVQNMQRWQDMLSNQLVLLAKENTTIVGFATLDKGDYIDFLYVHKDHQRRGIAETLLSAIEAQAILLGAHSLSSDISITARPFMERKGYTVVGQQELSRQGKQLINFKMVKNLL